MPEWLRRAKVGERTVVVDGKSYTIHIMAKSLKPELPGFVGYFCDQYFIVSEEVPEAYLPYVMAHEIREYTDEKLVGKQGRCRLSLRMELNDAGQKMSDQELLEYVRYRHNFFAQLVCFHREHKDPRFRYELATSCTFLALIEMSMYCGYKATPCGGCGAYTMTEKGDGLTCTTCGEDTKPRT